MQWIETATRDAVRHFAWGIGDSNPLWLDTDYAAASPLGGITAPPCMLYAVDSTIVAPKLPGVQWVYAGTDWTWYEPIRAGDTFTVEAVVDQAAGKIRPAVQALGAANRRSAIPESAWPLSPRQQKAIAPARPAAPIMQKMPNQRMTSLSPSRSATPKKNWRTSKTRF